MKRTLLSAVFLCLLVLRASGEEYFWRADGKPVTDREYMKIEKNFGAWLCLIDDEKFLQDWLKPTEGIDIPKLKTTKRPLTPRRLELGIDYLGFEIGDKLSAGKYVVEARVRDRIKEVELTLVHHLDVE